MMSLTNKIYERIAGIMPPALAGRLDFVRPGYLGAWGGPLNGQERRRDLVREIAQAIDFDRVIETGTYRGTSTEFFAAVFGTPVETVEKNPRFYCYAERRLGSQPTIRVQLGDSRTFLRELAAEHSPETVFIYLDAHWEDDLPLREELEVIAEGWKRVAVMIDDFAVPGDAGYSFDSYSPSKTLNEQYLPAERLDEWSLYYPSAPSSAETGARRGCCVLVSPAIGPLHVNGMRPSQ